MMAALAIGSNDDIVEFAPGLGATARMALQKQPRGYIGIERDQAASQLTREALGHQANEETRVECQVGKASETGLAAASSSVVYGEAMLTMQTATQKAAIIGEAFRILKPGGRYGIHELGVTPDDLSDAEKARLQRALSGAIRVGARPLTQPEWRKVLMQQGFDVAEQMTARMHLLEPRRMVQDEGVGRTLRIAFNIARAPAARKRVLAMRKVFRDNQRHLCATMIIARKPLNTD